MLKIEDDETGGGQDKDLPITIIIPVMHPVPENEIQKLFIRNEPNYGATANRASREETRAYLAEFPERVASLSAIQIFSVDDTPEETLAGIVRRSNLEPSEDLTRVAECAAFWKSIGADTLIYVCSMGVSLVANGLIIRFAGFSPLYSTLIFGGTGALSYNNSQLFFNSLIKPPKDRVPEDKQASYGVINKYALLPFSLVIKSAVTGSILSALGDTNVGTQQAISAATSPMVGPITTGLRTVIRKCYRGSYVLAPEIPDVGQTFHQSYGTVPNPADFNRSHRFGTARDMFAKLFGVTAGTLALSYSGGFKIETYCHPTGNQTLDLWNSTTVQNNIAFPDNCIGGNFTFMFRELGISFGYAIGFLIVEPAIAAVTNRIYDYFYPATGDDDEILLEDIDERSAGDDS